jgi:hypothetical protein
VSSSLRLYLALAVDEPPLLLAEQSLDFFSKGEHLLIQVNVLNVFHLLGVAEVSPQRRRSRAKTSYKGRLLLRQFGLRRNAEHHFRLCLVAGVVARLVTIQVGTAALLAVVVDRPIQKLFLVGSHHAFLNFVGGPAYFLSLQELVAGLYRSQGQLLVVEACLSQLVGEVENLLVPWILVEGLLGGRKSEGQMVVGGDLCVHFYKYILIN